MAIHALPDNLCPLNEALHKAEAIQLKTFFLFVIKETIGFIDI